MDHANYHDSYIAGPDIDEDQWPWSESEEDVTCEDRSAAARVAYAKGREAMRVEFLAEFGEALGCAPDEVCATIDRMAKS